MQASRDGYDSLLATHMDAPPQFNKEHRTRYKFHDENSQKQTADDIAAIVLQNRVFFYSTGQYHK